MAVLDFEKYLHATGLIKDIHNLVGKNLLCHCDVHERCHGDALLLAAAAHEASSSNVSMATFVDDGLPTRAIPAEVAEAPPPEKEAGWRGRSTRRRAQGLLRWRGPLLSGQVVAGSQEIAGRTS